MMARTGAIFLALALTGVAVFGIVYGAQQNSEPAAARAGDRRELLSAAEAISAHARRMRDSGVTLMEAGRAAGKQAWIDIANEHIKDARGLDQAADQLRKMYLDLILFSPDQGIHLVRLRADGLAIEAAGQVLLDHCSSMENLSAAIAPDARSSEAMLHFQGHLLADTDSLQERGRSVAWIGRSLVDRVDVLERSLAR